MSRKLDLRSLNPPQLQAVTHKDGPMLVLAGAGSGKTRVITYRIAYLVEQGVAPESIVAVSFTNKAAGEMRERVADVMGATRAKSVVLSTFHALGAQILRENVKRVGLIRPFNIVDEGERRRLLRAVLKELNLDGSSAGAANLLGLISRAKNEMTTPSRMREARFNPDVPRAQLLYERYEAALRNLNAVDFDDLLLLPTKMLLEHDDLRERYRETFRYFMVDEFQDTNNIQLRMLDALVDPKTQNLAVVGDDDQSIYGFRGAESDTILNFDKMLPNARVVTLDQNYRSVGSVLRAANAVISNNPKRRDKSLWSDLGSGHRIRSVSLQTTSDEAEFVAEWIERQADRELRGWQDFAVLYRSNNQAMAFEEAFRRRQLPYRVVGGQSAFDQKEVRDLLAYLKVVLQPHDDLSLRRIINFPTRGIGTVTLTQLLERAQRDAKPLWLTLQEACDDESLPDATTRELRLLVAAVEAAQEGLDGMEARELAGRVEEFVGLIGLQRAIFASEQSDKLAHWRWDVIARLIKNLERISGEHALDALERWVTDVSLDANSISTRDDDDDAKAVTMMTVHASKGLEFPIVFLVGMNEGILPHRRALDELRGVEEERRLCYVGMTRAKERLVLTRARWATAGDKKTRLLPSRFLKEVPEDLLDDREIAGGDHFAVPDRDQQLERFGRLLGALDKT